MVDDARTIYEIVKILNKNRKQQNDITYDVNDIFPLLTKYFTNKS
jgi:hypothetical protein